MTKTSEKIRVSVTSTELTNVLMNVERGTFGYLHFETKVRMNKTGNPYFDRITKVTKGNIYLGGNYEQRVRNETGNTEFVPEKNNVGEHISKCVLHNDNTNKDYLQYEWFEEVLPKSKYLLENDEVEKSLFESFMTKYTPNKNGVNVQSVTISNIKECHIDGKEYIVVNP